MYLYETHLHTSPVSRCAVATVRDSLLFYRSLGYDGVFITNHFLDGNINIDAKEPYAEKINFFFSDYEEGVKIGREIGLKVFPALESSYMGTDFLVYGLDKQWFSEHSEWTEMKKSKQLNYFAENGALIIQAHPYREAAYIDHIRLFPRNVEGVEIINASCKESENQMAEIYASHYGLLRSAGSDNHHGAKIKHLAGVETEKPLESVEDFIRAIRDGSAKIFEKNL